MQHKTQRAFELAIAFWAGIGLMSIINFRKIAGHKNAVLYSRIMFGFSVLFILISFLILFFQKRENK